MATISKLVHVFTALAGAPEPANAYRARQLREAGLIPTFGRGRYGAEMTPAAAANLIVGVLAAETDAHRAHLKVCSPEHALKNEP